MFQGLGTSFQLVEQVHVGLGQGDTRDAATTGSELIFIGEDNLIRTFDPSGIPVSSYTISCQPFLCSEAVTFTESKFTIVEIERLSSTSREHFLREIDPISGVLSSRLTPDLGGLNISSLAFDGDNIALAINAIRGNNLPGVLTAELLLFDSTTFLPSGTISLTVDTGTGISSGPVAGIAFDADGGIFLAINTVGMVYHFDSTFTLIEEISVATVQPRGLAVMDGDLFVIPNEFDGWLRYSKVANPIPEPSTSLLLTLGLLGLGVRRHRTSFVGAL